MMRSLFFLLIGFCGLLASCNSTNGKPEKKVLTEKERMWLRVDSVKALAVDGDLVTRLNDNIISVQVRMVNDKDKSYSHGGIIQTVNHVKVVCHIDADEKGADTIRYEPLDSFLNPEKNISCGLFRYDLAEEERRSFLAEINNFHAQRVRFDRIYVLETDSVLYCSEMIYKSLRKATHDRIILPSSYVPKPMLKMVYNYLDRKYPEEAIAANKIITIDNLYLVPQCREIIRFQLKEFPGQ